MRMQKINYPAVIIFKEKHGDTVYLATSEDEFHGAFMEVFVRRYTDGYWFDEDDIEEYRAELNTFETEGERVYFFMTMRGDYEYEGFDIIEPRVIRDTDIENAGWGELLAGKETA